MRVPFFLMSLFSFLLLFSSFEAFSYNKPTSPLTPLLKSYLSIQKHLATDEVKPTVPVIQLFLEETKKLKSSPSHSSLKPLLTRCETEATQLLALAQTVNPPTTPSKELRIQFGNLSKELISYLKEHPEEAKPYQLFFCPMFPQGYAFWFQLKDSALANPYWGQEMLTCGVRRTW